jgi:lipopolysaccharide biosynthesis regulator YciM
LARVYIHQGKYPEARNLCQRVINALESVFDKNHPYVTKVLETMAQLQHEIASITEVAGLK